jgi:hypothetical protein
LVFNISRPDPALEAPWPKGIPRGLHSFKDIIKHVEAVYCMGETYTHEELIKVIARQMGGAHEDDDLVLPLAAMKEILINGAEPYVQILVTNAELSLEVGERVIASAEQAGDYMRRKFSPPLTLSTLIRLREVPLGRVAVATFHSDITGTTVDVYLGPQAVTFEIHKGIEVLHKLTTPFPKDWKPGQDAAFSLTYEHHARRLRALAAATSGQTVEGCDLGFLDVRDIRPALGSDLEPYVELRGLFAHDRLLTQTDLQQFPELLIDNPTLEGS